MGGPILGDPDNCPGVVQANANISGIVSQSSMKTASNPLALRIFVLHWFALEQYPPVMNLLNYFSGLEDCQVAVCSTHNDRGLAEYANSSIEFSRIQFPSRGLSRFRRLLAFLMFPMLALWKLICFRPNVVIYVEPHSSFPAVLFRLVNGEHKLFIHSHEYCEQGHFRVPGMRLVAFYHWFEKHYLYVRAEWISQTNADRVRMFCDDYPHLNRSKLHVLPNLPPASWRKTTELTWISNPQDTLKLLYVGAVSLHDTFIAELVEWLRRQPNGQFSLDVYSTNCDGSAQDFLHRSAAPYLRFHSEGIPYDRLPDVLPEFHVGLILYKANTTNYVYNETNKLFEYLACGLDVWYPRQMLGIKPHARTDVAPRVIEIDFERLDELPVSQLRIRSGLKLNAFDRRSEDALCELKQAMFAVPDLSKDSP